MEKYFSPNRFFLLFCLIFVVEWLALQIVGYMRLTNMAKADGERLFSWNWPDKKVHCTVQIWDTKILSRNNNDAIVRVSGKQDMQIPIGDKENEYKKEKSDCTATLTYYRTNNQWFLGKVDMQ